MLKIIRNISMTAALVALLLPLPASATSDEAIELSQFMETTTAGMTTAEDMTDYMQMRAGLVALQEWSPECMDLASIVWAAHVVIAASQESPGLAMEWSEAMQEPIRDASTKCLLGL
jgi:hypothetical protein